jgi:uncharacterized RDD family membrane protein YckC
MSDYPTPPPGPQPPATGSSRPEGQGGGAPDGSPGPSTPARPATPARTPTVEDFPDAGVNALAMYSQRAWARVIDEVLVNIPFFFVLLVLLASTLGADGQPTSATEEVTKQVPLWLVAGSFALAIAYETIAIGWRGQTIGKWILGIRVARFTDGTRPGWDQALLRCLLPTCGAIVAFWLLGISAFGAFAVLASAYFNTMRRGWHDEAGGTVVVRTR